GREILTEALGEMGVVPDSAGQEQQLYHSYTAGGKLGKDESVVSSSSVSVCSGVSTTDSPSSTTQMNAGFEESTMTPGYRGRLSGRLSSATASSPRGGKGSVTPVSRNISESDSANIRRSQRQQDRIERQEAERILAENQQMLQREKEIMAKALTVSSPSPVTPQPPVNVGIVSSTQTIVSTTPVTPHVVTPVPEVPRTTPVVDSTTRLSVSTVEKLDDSNVRRPIRNRKLPAHLADPNYLSLEDATTAVKEATRRLSTTQEAVQPVEEIIPPQEEASDGLEDETKEEIADDYTEDDPNRLWCICRQPHNNRFMICCDRCEDWFHGKCVNVTKSQGKAMEIKNIPWHCPDCKKNIAAEKKAEVQVVVTQKQVKQQQQQQQSVVPEKTGRGRKSETQTSPKLVSAKTAKAAAA
ncbi:Death-inducer obliterator 1, partial [Orchesella cincta]